MPFPRIPLSRLRSLWPSGRTRIWFLVLLIGVPVLLIGGLLLASSLFRFDLQIDLAWVAGAVAATVFALALYRWVQFQNQPQRTVSVGYKYKLVQPMLPVGRYAFKLEIFYEVEDKGERRTFQQAQIEMRFRRKDHPELLEWCSGQIASHLKRHGALAQERYPGAKVLLSPEPITQRLAADPSLRYPEPASGDLADLPRAAGDST